MGEHADHADFTKKINEIDAMGQGTFDFQKFVDLCAKFRKPPITEPELQEIRVLKQTTWMYTTLILTRSQ